MKIVIKLILIIIVLIIVVFNLAAGENLDKFAFNAASSPTASPIVESGQFNGYTNYWHSVYWKWLQYGNLYAASQIDLERSIAQNKVDIAEELGIPGLSLTEGFLEAWLKGPAAELEDPDTAALEKALDRGDVFV